jgi:hypothetical protein
MHRMAVGLQRAARRRAAAEKVTIRVTPGVPVSSAGD